MIYYIPDDLHEEIMSIWSDAKLVQRVCYILMGKLDRSLDPHRGCREPIDRETITLIFQEEEIDTLVWLAGEAWERAKALSEKLEPMAFEEKPT